MAISVTKRLIEGFAPEDTLIEAWARAEGGAARDLITTREIKAYAVADEENPGKFKYSFELDVLTDEEDAEFAGTVRYDFRISPNRSPITRFVANGAATSMDAIIALGVPSTPSIESFIIAQLALIPVVPTGGEVTDFLRGDGDNGAEWANFNDSVLDAEILEYSANAAAFENEDSISEFINKSVTRFAALFPSSDGTKFWANDGEFKTIVLADYQLKSEKNQVNGYAGLDAAGLIDVGIIPALKSHEFVVVADSAARLALSPTAVQLGDKAFELDTDKTYILIASDPTEPASWRFIADTTPDWTVIQDKPLTFAPSAHNHAASDINSGTFPTARIADNAVTFAKIQNIATAGILGRSTAAAGNVEEISVGSGLNLAAGVLSSTGSAVWGLIGGTLADQTDLQDAFDAKQNSLGFTPENIAGKNQANGYAGLDSNGYLDPSAIPALKSHEFVVVADQSARLALTTLQIQLGDEVFQTDTGETYKLISSNPALSGSWQVVADTTPDWSAIQNKPTTFTPSAHNHAASEITSGTLDAARIPSLDAAKITTGTINSARLGTGTADSTTYLRGDGSWQTVSGGVAKVGTPVNNQLGIWTGDGTIEGDANLTYDGTKLLLASSKIFESANLSIAYMSNLGVNGISIESYANTLRFNAFNCNIEFRRNGTDKFEIDNTTDTVDTAISIYLNSVKKRVSAGATDSGGAGKRMLVIPN